MPRCQNNSAARVSTGGNFVCRVYKIPISKGLTLLTCIVCLEILVLKSDLLSVIPTDYNKSPLQLLTLLVRERKQPLTTVVTNDAGLKLFCFTRHTGS